jgi:hypothetical protein
LATQSRASVTLLPNWHNITDLHLLSSPATLPRSTKPVFVSILESAKMQRNNYGNPAPATSPPLHHPVPQHVSTVPQLRSPPPAPQPQHQQSYGNPYPAQASQAAPNAFGAYGGFMTDPTAQMGFQVGQTALKHGTEYVEQNVSFFDCQI